MDLCEIIYLKKKLRNFNFITKLFTSFTYNSANLQQQILWSTTKTFTKTNLQTFTITYTKKYLLINIDLVNLACRVIKQRISTRIGVLRFVFYLFKEICFSREILRRLRRDQSHFCRVDFVFEFHGCEYFPGTVPSGWPRRRFPSSSFASRNPYFYY